jgi:O-antigen/teichoic acid export membrane protein
MRKPLIITAIDEALLSATNFGISLVFIRAASKYEFGVYTLITGIILLLRGVQNAVIVTPLTTHGARLGREQRDAFVAAVDRLQVFLGVVGASLLAGALLVRGGENALVLACSAAIATLGTWLREFQRSVWLLEERNGRALAGDLAYVLLAAVGILAVWQTRGTVTTPSVLAILGVSALVPGVVGLARQSSARPAALKSTARLLFDQGKWTLPGMAVIWGQNTGYAYLVSFLVNTAAVATLATARLFIMPVMLLLTAWGRIYIPRAGTLIADDKRAEVRRLAVRGILVLSGVALPFFACVATFFVLGGMQYLSAKYQGVGPYVAWWAAFCLGAIVRSAASNALLAYQAFRELFSYAVVAAIASLALVTALVPLVGIGGAVAGLVTGEAILVGLTWRRLDRER